MALPLRRRPQDIALMAFFSLALLYGVVYSLPVGLGLWPISADSPYAPFRALHGWATTVEPAQLDPPPSLRGRSLLDGFVYVPFLAVLLYALGRGRGWIRLPAFLYAGSAITNLLGYLYESFHGPHPPLQPATFWALNLPWLLVPCLLAYRLRRERPFGPG